MDVVLPVDQIEGTTSAVSKWFKGVGDAVRKDDPLLEVTTDKVTVEIAAPTDGVLAEILKPEGESVEPGEVLGRIGAVVEAAPESPEPRGKTGAGHAAPPPVPGAAVGTPGGSAAGELSPAVRRLIQEHGLDPASIEGTGRGGRITVQDVEAVLAGGPADRRTGGPVKAGLLPGRMVPHSAMRKSIAEHMVRSVATAPHVTALFEADLSAVVSHRDAHRAAFQAQGVSLTYTAYFVRATVAALRAVPEANSRWHEDALELFEDCNIGIATALEGGGLIVPVLHRAQELDLLETARRLQDLTTRARAGRLQPADVHGGTFTISNHGVSGSLLAAPIVINQPQSAILGVGKIETRVRVSAAGGFEARPCAYVTLTIDHRVLDGFQANAFLSKWVEEVERCS
jgi:2-oxoglutarate dehydrogenase E2 component (dihydrolipoamide succinyltransferase)